MLQGLMERAITLNFDSLGDSENLPDINEQEIGYRLASVQMELDAEVELVHGAEVSTEIRGHMLKEYLERGKDKMLLEHLGHYRFSRGYLGEEDDRGGRVRCLRFCLEDEEEIFLERYSQIIIDDRKLRVFILNYKEADEGHCIMQGDISDRSSLIKVQKVNARIE
jgi:hypothetical protein